jgi:hypothetical protein
LWLVLSIQTAAVKSLRAPGTGAGADNDARHTTEEAATGSDTTAAATMAGTAATTECKGTNFKLLRELLELTSDSDSDNDSENAAVTGV